MLFLYVLALAGCGDDVVSSDAGGGADGGVLDGGALDGGAPDAGPLVVWEPCAELVGERDDRVECAVFDVPLFHDEPGGPTIELFVKRIRAAAPSDRSLWMLMGGPGQSGSDGEPLAGVLAARDPGIDIYLPDHRGTGLSTALTCSGENPFSEGGPIITAEEWPACRDQVVAAWGEELAGFSSAEAARDVAWLIDRTGAAAGRPFVLGISYGTFLATRYLQVAPDQAAGVILDSLCPPGTCFLSELDVRENGVAREILSHCVEDEACRAHLGDDAWAYFGETLDALAGGSCELTGDPTADVELVKTLSGIMMFSSNLRRLVPAVLYRLRRCSEADVDAIDFLVRQTFGAPLSAFGSTPAQAPLGWSQFGGYSWPLAINILYSEMWEPSEPTREELEARWQTTYSCRGVSRNTGYQTTGWPRYTHELADGWPATSVPVLAMNAELDTATPAEWARVIVPSLGANQRYIEVPHAGHSVLAQGQMNMGMTTCGRELALQFIGDPAAELDTSCLAETLPLAFFAREEFVELYLGTRDLWGDAPP
jgi:pimeloyl-ACP methyl ester carboxylesterase